MPKVHSCPGVSNGEPLQTNMMPAMAMMGRMLRAGGMLDCRRRRDRGRGGLRRVRPEITGNDQSQERQAQDTQQPGNDQSTLASRPGARAG